MQRSFSGKFYLNNVLRRLDFIEIYSVQQAFLADRGAPEFTGDANPQARARRRE
jgi:hypothetical protein